MFFQLKNAYVEIYLHFHHQLDCRIYISNFIIDNLNT